MTPKNKLSLMGSQMISGNQKPNPLSPDAVTYPLPGISPSGANLSANPLKRDKIGQVSHVIGNLAGNGGEQNRPLESKKKPLPTHPRKLTESQRAFLARRWPKRTIEERFWQKVAKGIESACWPWQARKLKQGYGQFQIRRGLWKYAHRMAWELTHGNIPEGLHVLHSCDHPPCCNPKHLWLGTHQQNMADMKLKGRHRKGGQNAIPR